MNKYKIKKNIFTTIKYILIVTICFLWVFPIVWLVCTSFNSGNMYSQPGFFPTKWTFENYKKLFFDTDFWKYPKWFMNTLLISVISAIGATILKILTAYVMSRYNFKGKKGIMKFVLVNGMFPGFMTMIAIYVILMLFDLTGKLGTLPLIYIAGAGLGFFIEKGYFDNISKEIEEAAIIDGASNFRIFWNIMLPLAKPIIIYTALMSFSGPWSDYIFAKMIIGGNRDNWTVAIGLMEMANGTNGDVTLEFSRFAAGSVFIAVPITILFISLQKYLTVTTSGAVKG